MDLTGQQFIGGQWLDGNGVQLTSTNPFSDSEIWNGNFADTSQCHLAIAAAKKVTSDWTNLDLEQRVAVVQSYAQQLQQHHEELSLLITRENGKPLWESRTEVNACIGKVQNSIDALRERRWTSTTTAGHQASVIRYRAHGVMTVLGPFNFPAHLPGAHIVPAILAGNTVVFKPSEQTPAVGEFLVRLWQAAGLPSGVLNLVHGLSEVASTIAYHEDSDGVLFTGSHRVGKILHEGLAGKPEKILALELGGNNALVVDEVSNIDAAVHEIILSAYITSGQRCTCARRLFVTNSSSAKAVLNRLMQVIPSIGIGDPESNEQAFLGSLISTSAADAVLESQSKWESDAVAVHHQMTQPIKGKPSVLSPGLIEVTDNTRSDHETFGPLLLVQQVPDLDAAIIEANRSRYGLSAGLLSDNLERFQYFVQRIHAGIVNWNRQTTGASGRLPFGGIGWSGNHQPSGFFATDYCSYPIASLENNKLEVPDNPSPGLNKLFA